MGNSLTPVIRTPPVLCKDCGAPMVLRRPKPYGTIFEPFFGCRNWPHCKHAQQAFYDEIERRWKAVEPYEPDWGWPGEL